MTEKRNREQDILLDQTYRRHYNEFVDKAAHDLLSPLRKLGVLIDRLTSKYKSTQDEEVLQYTGRINTCIDELRSLVEGFNGIAVAIPENMQIEECDLHKLMHRLVQEFSSQVKSRQAEINIGELPVVKGDKSQLRRLFKELLENAFRFSKPGVPLKIEIKCSELKEEQRRMLPPGSSQGVQIIIEDSGIGFDSADKERIFEPLVRLHGKSEFTGQGLGLALVKKIAENHGWTIYAEAELQNFARFILLIPYKS